LDMKNAIVLGATYVNKYGAFYKFVEVILCFGSKKY